MRDRQLVQYYFNILSCSMKDFSKNISRASILNTLRKFIETISIRYKIVNCIYWFFII